MLIEFTDDLLTGVEKIDEKHKELFVLFETLTKLIMFKKQTSEILKCVETIKKDLIEHFNDEENIMKTISFDSSMHIKEHKMFIENIDDLLQHKNKTLFEIKIIANIFEYLKNHINKYDKQLAKVLNKNTNTLPERRKGR